MSAVVTGPDVEAALWIGGLGITAFTLGLGFILNGLLFTKPRKALDDHPDAKIQNLLDSPYTPPFSRSTETPMPRSPTTSNLAAEKGASVTEHTTLNLKKD